MAHSDARKLAAAIAHVEGKKSQSSIGNIMEIISIITELDAEFRNSGTGVHALQILSKKSNELLEKKLKKSKKQK